MDNDVQAIIDQLINLGEDRDELHFWSEMSPHLTNEERDTLRKNLASELAQLLTTSNRQPVH